MTHGEAGWQAGTTQSYIEKNHCLNNEARMAFHLGIESALLDNALLDNRVMLPIGVERVGNTLLNDKKNEFYTKKNVSVLVAAATALGRRPKPTTTHVIDRYIHFNIETASITTLEPYFFLKARGAPHPGLARRRRYSGWCLYRVT